jgi:hypothetical protein
MKQRRFSRSSAKEKCFFIESSQWMCITVREKAGCTAVLWASISGCVDKETNWLSSSSVLSVQLGLLLVLFEPDGGRYRHLTLRCRLCNFRHSTFTSATNMSCLLMPEECCTMYELFSITWFYSVNSSNSSFEFSCCRLKKYFSLHGKWH